VRTTYDIGGQTFASKFSNTENITVAANLVNLPPVADAGADITASGGAAVTLSGVNSFDPNVEPISYAWTQISGVMVTLANANTAIAGFTAPSVNADTPLAFRLTVRDASGLTDTDDVVVTVRNPVATVGNNKLGGALSSLSLLVLGLLRVLSLRRRRR
jgi:hypothetical protein